MKVVVGITGSSGAVYALDFLKKCPDNKYLIVSKWGKVLLQGRTEDERKGSRAVREAHVLGRRSHGAHRVGFQPLRCVRDPSCVHLHDRQDRVRDSGDTLITRTAQVCLKERIPLIICVRETPLSTLTLEQCARLSGYGATIMPISPPLYFVPETVDAYVGAFTDKVLGQIGVRTSPGWREEEFT